MSKEAPQSIESVPPANDMAEAKSAEWTDPAEIRAQADRLVAEGKKAIALKSWEEGVAKYADALDLMRQLVGDFDPQMAPLLLSYGKALYELAFSQQGVMGKEEVAKETGPALEAEASGSNLIESAEFDQQDGEDAAPAGEEEQEDEPGATLGDTSIAQSVAPDEEVDEPEDDYNAAWEVLDVARTIYSRMVEGKAEGEGKEDRLCLAECYLALGDVSCETENFPQAVQDYTSALKIKSSLLPSSSRALASVHYQLATALEFTPNRRGDALSHVEKAVEGFKSRLSELRGEAVAGDEVAKLSEKEKYKEVEDVLSLLGDLEVKIEELKQAPPAEDLVSESINHLLGQPSGAVGNGSGEAKADSGPVNDLTGMVKKKKKPVQAAVQVTAQEVAGKGKEVADKLVKKVEAAGEVAEGVEGGIGGVAEEIADGINGKRKAEDKAGGEEKKIKAE